MEDIRLKNRSQSLISYQYVSWALYGFALVAVIFIPLGLSYSEDIDFKIKKIEEREKQLPTSLKNIKSIKLAPLGRFCQNNLGVKDYDTLRSVVNSQGLRILYYDISEGEYEFEGKLLKSYNVDIKTRGSYDQSVNLLVELDKIRPVIFLNNLSVNNHINEVGVEIKGSIYCL